MDLTLSEEERILLMSDDVRRFLNSDAGKFVVARLNSEIEQTQADLVDVSPEKPLDVIRLQERFKLIAGVLEDIEGIQEAGDHAFNVINNSDEDI